MCASQQRQPQTAAAVACKEKKKKLSAKRIHAHVCVVKAIYNPNLFIGLFI